MQINPFIFRGYDLRGIAGKDLTPEIVEHLGMAYGTYLKRRGTTKLVVGHDSRATSPEYSAALIRGLVRTGADVADIGMNLVGTFYWSQYFLKRRGGVFVSASHNPPEYNGFKFANDYSETLVSEGMQELRDMVLKEDYELSATPGTAETMNIRDAYFEDLVRRLPLGKKFRVVVDPSNSTAGEIIPELLRKAGCEVIEKNCTIDSSFPLGIADPTSSLVAERLRREVLEARADLGFSYDADGDRMGIVDESGQVIWSDVVVALFALDVLGDHPGATIMYNILCSKVVEEAIRGAGGVPFMWRVGYSFLRKKNQEVKAAFIGELSGHFFFSRDFYNHDDGAYATLRLLRYLAKTGLTLSGVVASLPKYISSPEVKICCPDDKKVALIEKIAPLVRSAYPAAEVVDDERAVDGLRWELEDAMAVIRYSQNGPYITVKFEGKTKERYEELRAYFFGLLKQFSEIDWASPINLNVEALRGES